MQKSIFSLCDDRMLRLSEMEWLWQEKEQVGQGQEAFNVPKLCIFYYLCAHAILQHGEARFRLQRYYDLHLLATQGRMNWDLVLSRSIELGWIYTVERALVLTRYYFATPVPDRVLAGLKNHNPSDQDYLRARRLQGAGARWEGTLINLSEYPWRERLRLLFHLAFPRAETMRTRYKIPAG
jgi:hypothetical protein